MLEGEFGGKMRIRIAALLLLSAIGALAIGPPPIPIVVENLQ
jgi:hypothetical protein